MLPFFKFPIEIRRRIYQLLLGPLYKYDKAKKAFFIEIQTTIDSNSLTSRLTDATTSSRSDRHTWNHVRTRQALRHPTRKPGYSFQIGHPPASDQPHRPRVETELEYLVLYDWLRQVSYLSTAFRFELQREFWSHVRLVSRSDNPLGQIVALLEDRPRAAPGIKSVSTLIDRDWRRMELDPVEGQHISHLAEHLALDHLEFRMCMWRWDIGSLATDDCRYLSLVAPMKKFPVSGAFVVDVSLLSGSLDPGDLSREDPGSLGELGNQAAALVRELWLPDSLREKTRTEMYTYLASRPKDKESKDKKSEDKESTDVPANRQAVESEECEAEVPGDGESEDEDSGDESFDVEGYLSKELHDE